MLALLLFGTLYAYRWWPSYQQLSNGPNTFLCPFLSLCFFMFFFHRIVAVIAVCLSLLLFWKHKSRSVRPKTWYLWCDFVFFFWRLGHLYRIDPLHSNLTPILADDLRFVKERQKRNERKWLDFNSLVEKQETIMQSKHIKDLTDVFFVGKFQDGVFPPHILSVSAMVRDWNRGVYLFSPEQMVRITIFIPFIIITNHSRIERTLRHRINRRTHINFQLRKKSVFN